MMQTALIIYPHHSWELYTAALYRIRENGDSVHLEGMAQASEFEEEATAQREVIRLSHKLLPQEIYKTFGVRNYRKESIFWADADKKTQKQVQQFCNKLLCQMVSLSNEATIPLFYRATLKSELLLANELRVSHDKVTPLMHFVRNEEEVTYSLKLRVGKEELTLSQHPVQILAASPGLIRIDNTLHIMPPQYSGRIVMPFLKNDCIRIPKRMEDEYFRKFILHNVAWAEISSEGFDIQDLSVTPSCKLTSEEDAFGNHILVPHFLYGKHAFTITDKRVGCVWIETDGTNYTFMRILRNKQWEAECIEKLSELYNENNSGTNGILRWKDAASQVDWLRTKHDELRQAGFHVQQLRNKTYYVGQNHIVQHHTWVGDWLQLHISIKLDDGLELPFSQLRDTILNGSREHVLPTGETLIIPEEWVMRYGEVLLLNQGDENGVFRIHRHTIKEFEWNQDTQGCKDTDFTIPSTLKATLRPYQHEGYKWMLQHLLSGSGCCLSDEMGLGKTVQTIALLLKYKAISCTVESKQTPQDGFLFSEEEMSGKGTNDSMDRLFEKKTCIIVSPASLVHNWRNELQRFAPTLSLLEYTGTVQQRQQKRVALMSWDVVITTYHTLSNDIEYLNSIDFGVAVFDESQAFKNRNAQVYAAVRKLKATQHIALSGTPIENNLSELWSLMSVLDYPVLGDFKSFEHLFMRPIADDLNSRRTEVLRKMVSPYMLKRTKEQVLSDLPERQDETIVCPMTEEQAAFYQQALSQARNEILRDEEPQNVHVLTAIQQLRQIANGEGKIEVLMHMLSNLRGTKHRVLLFSEYVGFLERISQEMKKEGWAHNMMTGQTLNREKVIDDFRQHEDHQFFLVSLKAGGVGLNLTEASYVFLLDPWWNLSAEEQAIGRAHRIGQKQSVFVYRLVSEGTLEEQILHLQERKQNVIDAVMPFILKKK